MDVAEIVGERTPPKYESIVLLTGGMYKHPARQSGWKPELNAHMRTAAAAELYDRENPEKIVVSGGQLYGEDQQALSPVLKEELNRNYDVPLEDIITEEKSLETTENAEFTTEKLIDEGLDGKILLVTGELHLPRAKDSFKKYWNDEVYGYPAEEVVERLSKRHKDLIKDYREKDEYKKVERTNNTYHNILNIPLVGEKILRYAAHKTRG